jgi:glycosyltransferase involved in cell wall biosynthesis
MIVTFSCYPLTADFRAALGRFGAADEAITLSNLRALPLPRILSTLRRTVAERIWVVVGEPTERSLLPILLMLAALTRAGRVELVDLPTGEIRTVPRLRALTGVMHSIRATLAGRYAKVRAEIETRQLMRAEEIPLERNLFEHGFYLKSNLMLGTLAGGSVGHIAGVANELFRRSKSLVLAGLEFPMMVNRAIPFASIRPLKHYGIPPESNHLRFDRHCVEAGSKVLKDRRIDYIYQRLSIANFSGVKLSRRYKVPLILEYNGSEVWIAQHWGLKLAWTDLAKRVEQVCFRHAHRIVTVSDVLADELRAQGVPEEKIVNYPNCIDPEVFDPALYDAERRAIRQSLGIGDDELVCTFLGTFGAWHGAEVLSEAIRRYRATAPAGSRRLRFLMIGDGLLAGRCREMLAQEVAVGDVIFTGIVAQAKAPGYLAASDVFLSPHVQPSDGSRFFGSPTKLFEYMAMARPIVASALDQIADVLCPAPTVREARSIDRWDDEHLAVLCEPGSVDDIVVALGLLRDRPEWHSVMGAAARRKALACYTWRQHVEQIFRTL